jgi:hypothetical protein
VALQAMVDPEKIRAMLRKVTKQKGKFSLAMLVQTSPDLPLRWSLVVSAPWIDLAGLKSSISYLSSQMLANLDKTSVSVIDRISPISTKDPVIRDMATLSGLTLDDPGRPKIISNWQVGDWFIPFGFLFVADPSPGQTAMHPVKNGTR